MARERSERKGTPLLSEELEAHFGSLIRAFTRGRVTPFLGAGANLCSRPEGEPFRVGSYLPSGQELSLELVRRFTIPGSDPQHPEDLARVAQYVAVVSGFEDLYEELRSVFDADYPPTPLHDLLAGMPALLRAKGYPTKGPLIVSTNYDDVLERAFRAADEPVDVVVYMTPADRKQEGGMGRFVHFPPDGEARPIDIANSYEGIPVDGQDLVRPVILKIHGAVNRAGEEGDSYVITEDDYINYLSHAVGDIANLIPASLLSPLKRNHILFLGYSLRDWNLRVILNRLWGDRERSRISWAVQLKPKLFEETFWQKKDVKLLDIGVDRYVEELSARLNALPSNTEITARA